MSASQLQGAKMKPLRSTEYGATRHILNPARPYTPAARTDIRETFARLAADRIEQKVTEKKTVRRVK